MKRIVNNWICVLATAGLIAGGCSPGYIDANRSFVRIEKPGNANLFAPGSESFQEVWILERDAKVANDLPLASESAGMKAIVRGQEREMPLKNMDVHANLNGYISTVDVKQQFENPCAQKIEAVYVFKLPDDATVDDFIMTIGKRRIRGIIRERKDAEAIYEEAKRQGYLASLLTAFQANTFRQTIANIEPGNNIDVHIHYFQTLHVENGWYEFVFPTAFNSKGSSARGNVPVSLSVDVNAGAAIADVQSPGHVVLKKSVSPEHSTVQLSPSDGNRNEDFKLLFRLANGENPSQLMTHRDERGGYFTLLLHASNESPLNDVKIDWRSLQVSEIYAGDFTNIPGGRAVLIAGRFSGTTATAVVVSGTASNRPVSFSIPVDLSKTDSEKAIPKIWASMKIGVLELQSMRTGDLELLRETKQVALDYGLASPFTAFLAVDASEPTDDGKIITVPAVP